MGPSASTRNTWESANLNECVKLDPRARLLDFTSQIIPNYVNELSYLCKTLHCFGKLSKSVHVQVNASQWWRRVVITSQN